VRIASRNLELVRRWEDVDSLVRLPPASCSLLARIRVTSPATSCIPTAVSSSTNFMKVTGRPRAYIKIITLLVVIADVDECHCF
jgi:hypothetical protein